MVGTLGRQISVNQKSMSRKHNGGGGEEVWQVLDLNFKICNLGPKSAFPPPQNRPTAEPAENGQTEGNSGYPRHATRVPHDEGPSRAL